MGFISFWKAISDYIRLRIGHKYIRSGISLQSPVHRYAYWTLKHPPYTSLQIVNPDKLITYTYLYIPIHSTYLYNPLTWVIKTVTNSQPCCRITSPWLKLISVKACCRVIYMLYAVPVGMGYGWGVGLEFRGQRCLRRLKTTRNWCKELGALCVYNNTNSLNDTGDNSSNSVGRYTTCQQHSLTALNP